MIKIEGFDKARLLLARRAPFKSFPLPSELKEKIRNVFGEELSAEEVVERIIADVRDEGDRALFHYASKLDGVELDSLEVSHGEVATAYENVDVELASALKLAAQRISNFHLSCKRRTEASFLEAGLGQQIYPLDRVGIYVPGGTAAYPSTVLMTAIPARVAGVREIIMTTPVRKGGMIPASTLVAADIAQVDRIFKVGGAQAIASLAFGTESVPRVDKVCGPGNIFVVLAKKAVYGVVAIDGLQGPSEVIIVADEMANPALCAADLLAQAEHDPLASAVLITTSPELAERVDRELSIQLTRLERQAIAASALEARGMLVVIANIDEAVELVNLYAPEHLSLMLRDTSSVIQKIRNAGCIFTGGGSSVVLGDYIAGPSHVLPTEGSARFSSPLGVNDFLKITSLVSLDEATIRELAPAAITMARAEGLDAHARAMEMRLKREYGKVDKT